MTLRMVKRKTDDVDNAGRYAAERYQTSLKNWRRAALPTFRWLCWPAIALVLVASIIARVGVVDWFLGALVGACLMAYQMLVESPPDYVTNWKLGAEGERKTAAVLRGLRSDGVITEHDVQTGNRNWDHVVVSPKGVFLIETKNLSGTAYVEGGGLRVCMNGELGDGYRIPRLGKMVIRQAIDLSNECRSLTGEPQFVHPIVVLWGRFPERRVVDRDGVVYVHGSALRECLVTWQRELSPSKYEAGLRYLNRAAWSTRGL